MEFSELRDNLLGLYEAGAHAEAADLIVKVAAQHPEHADELGYWRLCLASLLGDRQLALRILSEAVADGRWFSIRMLRQDPDLAPLQGTPEFERLVAACEALRDAAQAKAERGRLTILPKAASPTARPPLLVALHGNGSAPASELDRWTSATDKGWLVALPQSTQVETPSGFSWWDRGWAVREAVHHVLEVVKEHDVDPDRMVLGGFSAGAGLAVRLALGTELAARGFIAVVPALASPQEIRSLLPSRGQARLRGYFVVGDRDQRARALAQALKSMLESSDIPCRLEMHPNVGHSYPASFQQSLERALDFILDA